MGLASFGKVTLCWVIALGADCRTRGSRHGRGILSKLEKDRAALTLREKHDAGLSRGGKLGTSVY